MADLERMLSALMRKALAVVDGLFSMGGDIAPLQLVDLCHQYSARLMVDDAHNRCIVGGTHILTRPTKSI
jgi:7-keto-8-aminopelargonate synthetase-like enzyme